MAITNHERVGKALEILKTGLAPFVEREIKSAIASNSISMARVREFVDDPKLGNKSIGEWDAAALLKLMGDTWGDVFRRTSRSVNFDRPWSCRHHGFCVVRAPHCHATAICRRLGASNRLHLPIRNRAAGPRRRR